MNILMIIYHQENLPKDEETKQKEMEELKKENDQMATTGGSIKTGPVTRERQLSNDTFISL